MEPKEHLLVMRQELMELRESTREAAGVVELDQSRLGRVSRGDALQAQAMSVEADRRRELQISRIDSALKRVAKGEYGLCLSCKDQIASRRLEADPAAPLCIGCAREHGG